MLKALNIQYDGSNDWYTLSLNVLNAVNKLKKPLLVASMKDKILVASGKCVESKFSAMKENYETRIRQ